MSPWDILSLAFSEAKANSSFRAFLSPRGLMAYTSLSKGQGNCLETLTYVPSLMLSQMFAIQGYKIVRLG
jgi:hypothetical protein